MNKFVFVACMFVIVATGAEERPRSEEFKKLMEQCKTETGASDDDMKNLAMRQPMTTKNGWCLVACIKKKTGDMDASNKFDIDKIKEHMSGLKSENADLFNKLISFMQECKEKVEADAKNLTDQCTAAQVFGTCIFTKKAAAGIP